MAVLKFLILLGLLLYASIKDLREHEVPNTVWKLIAMLGLVNITLRDLPSMLLGAALVFLPQIIPAVINSKKSNGRCGYQNLHRLRFSPRSRTGTGGIHYRFDVVCGNRANHPTNS